MLIRHLVKKMIARLFVNSISSSRCSQALFFPTTMKTPRIQNTSWLGLRWSAGGSTFSHSMGSWERSTLLYSLYTDVSTTSPLDDPLLKNCCNNWRQWGPKLRGGPHGQIVYVNMQNVRALREKDTEIRQLQQQMHQLEVGSMQTVYGHC